jgi:hypothetical protein
MMAHRPAACEEQRDAFTLEALVEGMGEFREHKERLGDDAKS